MDTVRVVSQSPGTLVAWSVLAIAIHGCSEATVTEYGYLGIQTETEGGAFDPDGFTVLVDGDSLGIIDVNEQRWWAIPEGSYSVTFASVADNCGAVPIGRVDVMSGVYETMTVKARCTPESELADLRLVAGLRNGIVGLNADGSDRVTLLTGFFQEPLVDVAPDGSRLVYAEINPLWEAPEVWLVDLPGGGNRKLVGYGTEPRWSPDGSEIAFAEFDRSWPAYHIRLADEDGFVTTQLTQDHTSFGWSRWPSWSPDGSRVAFLNGGHMAIVRRDAILERILDLGLTPVWSAHDRIAYVAAVTDSVFEVRVMSPDGADVGTLLTIAGGSFPRIHDWSPDAAWLLFTGATPSGTDLFLMHTESQVVVRVTGDGTTWSGSFWPGG